MKTRIIGFALLLISLTGSLYAQSPDPKQALAQIKTNLQTSTKNLASYTWIETTSVLKGEEVKSQTQNQCSIGPDGKVKKVPLTAPAEESSQRGVRGRIVENKKEEISEYVKKAIAKVQEYLPPNPEKLQAIYTGGKTTMKVIEPNKRYTLEFPDYLQAGDKVSISLDFAKGLFEGTEVLSWVENPEDKIAFALDYSVLADGTEYAAETRLDLPSEGLKIIIKNDSYKKVGQ